MAIDWFTLVAQIINFLLLVWLLKRFLYKPILDAIDARDNEVSSQIQNAAVQNEKAINEQKMFQEKNETFNKERLSLEAKMNKEVADEKQRLTEQVRKETEALRLKLEESLKLEQESFRKVFIAEVQKNIFSITQKMLQELASVKLEDQMVVVFIERIKNVPADLKDKFTLAIVNSSDPILVRSAFELSNENKKKIEDAFNKQFSAEVSYQYIVNSDQICGVELSTRDYKISWTIAEYLKTLENNTVDLLHTKTA